MSSISGEFSLDSFCSHSSLFTDNVGFRKTESITQIAAIINQLKLMKLIWITIKQNSPYLYREVELQ